MYRTLESTSILEIMFWGLRNIHVLFILRYFHLCNCINIRNLHHISKEMEFCIIYYHRMSTWDYRYFDYVVEMKFSSTGDRFCSWPSQLLQTIHTCIGWNFIYSSFPIVDELCFFSVLLLVLSSINSFVRIELIIVTDVKEFVFVRKLRPFVIVFAVVTACSIIPLGIWNAIAHSWLTDLVYNCAITLSALTLIALVLIGGKFLYFCSYFQDSNSFGFSIMFGNWRNVKASIRLWNR